MTALPRMRVAVVDDEPLARRRVLNLLAREPDVDVVAECDGGAAAVEAVTRLGPDILILDVRMPEVDGFDVLEALPRDHLPAVIFATAYDEYAIRAIDHHAIGYLVKPIDDERFRATFARIREALACNRSALTDRLTGFIDARTLSTEPFVKRLPVRVERDRVLLVPVEQIEWVHAESNYVQLHVNQTTYRHREAISALEARLDPERFMRVHRSTIVNIDRIREIRTGLDGDFLIILDGGARLVTSATYRDRVTTLIAR